ncbi:menaquinone biosynthetic enzyme MqnA/MqnD family protein [Geothermobacter hydrogeniphilus]|uniref:Chorismate dehydratase n=1 Tax=Geothermobacter hydrogeniphilus TaxID=1969733 RepID=A0A1X0Y1N7_9BACT|nr:menaquinone biosynthesis protein [Geothermobacter hydrogeniphilus]ORJ59100.1 hypothetical protein B5V00_11060 [Geothermobacter hydrogeniphilus]
MTLRVGHISYVNCVPFFHFLHQSGFNGEIVSGVPSELNRLLAAGDIDLSPSSSFEYALHWRDYQLLPGHSISSNGPVRSVLLFSPVALEELSGKSIAVTGESATSINLLQVLLREFHGCRDLDCEVPGGSVEEVIADGGSALLIGDRALRAAMRGGGGKIYDLGELWFRHTGLPFVFALWIVRRDAAAAKPEELSRFVRQLAAAREMAESDLQALAAVTPERSWLGEEGLVSYWRQMSYDFQDRHRRGLELFFRLCGKHGLLAEQPELSRIQT